MSDKRRHVEDHVPGRGWVDCLLVCGIYWGSQTEGPPTEFSKAFQPAPSPASVSCRKRENTRWWSQQEPRISGKVGLDCCWSETVPLFLLRMQTFELLSHSRIGVNPLAAAGLICGGISVRYLMALIIPGRLIALSIRLFISKKFSGAASHPSFIRSDVCVLKLVGSLFLLDWNVAALLFHWNEEWVGFFFTVLDESSIQWYFKGTQFWQTGRVVEMKCSEMKACVRPYLYLLQRKIHDGDLFWWDKGIPSVWNKSS